jgi:hypothetical protein
MNIKWILYYLQNFMLYYYYYFANKNLMMFFIISFNFDNYYPLNVFI